MEPFIARRSGVRGSAGDALRAGGEPEPPAEAVVLLAMPIYVIVEDMRTQALIGKPETGE